MAKWRTNRSFKSSSDVDIMSVDKLPPNVKINDTKCKYPIYEAWMRFVNSDFHISIDYPGGIAQFEKDAMAERELMLSEKCRYDE